MTIQLWFSRGSLLYFRKFCDTQTVPVGIFKPGDPRARRRGPDAQLILVHSSVALEANSRLPQVLNGCGDLRDLPARNRAMGWGEFLSHAETQHDSIGIKDQGEGRFFADQAKAQNVPIEIYRAGHVDNRDKPYDVVLAESGEL